MRRKSDRTRSTSSPPVTERTRRSSRRGKKTPSKSPELTLKSSEEKVSETENDGDIEKPPRDSSSDRDSEDRPSRRSRRSRSSKTVGEKSPSKRKRTGRSEKIFSIAEENGENNEVEKNNENEEVKKDGNYEEKSPCENDGKKMDVVDDVKETIVQSNAEEDNSNTVDATQTDQVSNNEQTYTIEDSQMEVDAKKRDSSAEGELEKKEQSEEKSSSNGETNNDNDSEEPEDSRGSSRFKASAEVVQESRWDIEATESRINNVEDKPRERRSRFDQRHKEAEIQKEEGKENVKNRSTENSKLVVDGENKAEKQSQPVRKRKWLSRKDSETKPKVLAISTDSLKNLISDVQPVPLSDIKLESSPEPEEIYEIKDERSERGNSRSKEKRHRENEPKRDEKTSLSTNRKISIIIEDSKSLQRPPSPPKNESSNILYITNLVRPFTVLQLKGLLARTGRIVENGFWMDRIKSKCYVKYETEDQAIETRHALHGVRWPTSNPKCLNVDFGTEAAMEKAIASTLDENPRFQTENSRDNRIVGTGWDKERLDFDEKKEQEVSRPIREWDVGKKEEFERDMERSRERDRDRERDRERRRRSTDRDDVRNRRSSSASPARKFKKKENDPPLRLLDDLFRKTKTAPCIYWLPLTPEQIAEKEEARRKRMEEHELLRKEREREREREREKEKEREKERDRDKERRRERSVQKNRRSRSRDRRRY